MKKLLYILLVIILTLNYSAQTYFEGGLIEEPCQKKCRCKHKEKSSKIEVAHCTVDEKDTFVSCNVEWPILLMTVKKLRFNADLLAACQRISGLLITTESSLIVLMPQMFKLVSRLETLVVQAPIQTIENQFLKNFVSLKILHISETRIEHLSRGMFSDCPITERIRLSSNRISVIADKTFDSCNRVVNLDLGNNRLTVIRRLIFNEGHSLQNLDLSRNRITRIEDFSFKNLKKMKVLNLNANLLMRIKPEILFGLESLQYLFLSKNSIETIEEDAFVNLKSLKYINLEKNPLLRPNMVLFLNLDNLTVLLTGVKCVDEQYSDYSKVSINVSNEFEKYPICSGIRKRNETGENKPLIQNSESKNPQPNPTKVWKTSVGPSIFDLHPYLFPMIFGGLSVLLISIIVIAFVCHIKNQQINELRLQELQNLPMMQSTL